MAPLRRHLRPAACAGLITLSALPAHGCKDDAPPAAPPPAQPKPTDPKPADTKPPETKPAETKPGETKPPESKPAEPAPKPDPANPPQTGLPTTPVTIAGKRFTLDVASTDATRVKGLGGRTDIPEDGGMIFVFPPSQVREMAFVMRDCPIDIDIIFLDGVGRALAMHEMKKEPPRGPDEGKPGDFTNAKYESKLKKYHSYFPASFAIELRAGTIKKLGVKEGDLVQMDVKGLKAMAK